MARAPQSDQLEDMTVKDLLDLQEQVEEAIAARQSAERVAIKDKVTAIITQSGFSVDDIFGGRGRGGSRGKVAPKYRNPDDPSQTWTGRGRKPNWIIAGLKKRGASLDNFAI